MIILFENNVKNIRMKTILEMMSLHCVPYILYWIQAERKFHIQTYCQIISVNFTNMVAIIFFKADVHIWLTIPSPCPHLSTFAWSLSPPPPLMCGHPLWMGPAIPGYSDVPCSGVLGFVVCRFLPEGSYVNITNKVSYIINNYANGGIKFNF